MKETITVIEGSSSKDECCMREFCSDMRAACSGTAARKLDTKQSDTKQRPSGTQPERLNVRTIEKNAGRISSSAPGLPLAFHGLELSDREQVAPYLAAEGGIAADQCFGTIYLWGESFGLKVAEAGDRLIAVYGEGVKTSFGFPAGPGELAPAIELMRGIAAERGAELVILGLSETQKEALEAAMEGCFTFEEIRDRAEYIYEAESLATLAGRKLHGKRNHCSRFEKEQPDWRIEELGPSNFAACISLVEKWELEHSGEGAKMQEAELEALRKTFDGFEALGMEGILLYVGDRPVAFTIGERVGADCFDVHFEKADVEINGAYPMVNREFVRLLLEKHPDLRLINREEDMGLENLRKAKESYRPAFLVNKYTARWNG